MKELEIKKIRGLCRQFSEVKLGYFFGSRATGTSGPISDYDFAFYIDEKDQKKIFDIQTELIGKISLILKTDSVDVVVLNKVQNPDIAFNVISTGKLFYEIEPYKVTTELKIMNLYFDFKMEREKNNLIKTRK